MAYLNLFSSTTVPKCVDLDKNHEKNIWLNVFPDVWIQWFHCEPWHTMECKYFKTKNPALHWIIIYKRLNHDGISRLFYIMFQFITSREHT